MEKYYWMKVTKDEYQLPIAIATSASGLARLLGIKTNTLYRATSKGQKDKYPQYVKIPRDDEIDFGLKEV